jgi:hypothetical protein
MADIRCPYCHESIPESDFPAHEAKHRKRRADGQQTDYATLPEEEREDGDLTGVPTVYVHLKCGAGTRMPEEIVRSYLKNPYLYSSDSTFCTGCGDHVPDAECEWVDTGENLQAYMDRLRAAKPEMKPKGCLAAGLVLIGGVGLLGTGVVLALV